MDRTKPILLFDADDVLENLLECWVAVLNSRYGTSVTASEITTWDVSIAFPDLTWNQVYEPLIGDEIWNALSPKPGSQRILKQLQYEGFEIYIVTATDYRNCKVKFDKLKEMFPFLDVRNFIVAHNKQMVYGDILVDDNPKNLIGGHYYGILYDAPHNRNFDCEQAGITRVHNFDEVYAAIKTHAIRFEYLPKR